MKSGLTPERWRALEPLLDQVFEASAADRPALVASLAGEDSALHAEMLALMSAAGDGDGILDRSVDEYVQGLASGPEPEPDAAGERVGPWRVLGELGRGGMGVVHLAERADGAFEQRVALKLLRRGVDTHEVLERFRRERQILAHLQHPHIARLLDGGATRDGRPYLAMEHVEGQPVTSWCDARRLGVEGRLRLFLDVCEAVEYAHRKLVVHRDLKPSNVLVTASGDVKLLDFGIAKLLGSEADEAGATRTGLRTMTPRYAAPEQVRGEPVTTATDTYALGLLLHELLVGRGPYRLTRDSASELESAILEQEPEAPSRAASAGAEPERAAAAERRGLSADQLARRLHGDLDAIVLTALRKEPERRYASAALLADDVRRHLEGRPVAARPPALGYRAGRFLKRHRVGVAAAALVALALGAGLAGTLWQARAKDREARKAEAVKKYLVDIFQVSAPSESRGRTVTARELLDRGAARVGTELGGQPELRAEMLGVIGDLYRTLGLLDQAEPLLADALASKRSLYGEESLEHAAALDRWGEMLWDRGRYQEARDTHRHALELRRRLLGGRAVAVAESLSNLAAVLRDLGDHDQAERLNREALEIDRAHYGPGHEAVATDLLNLGAILRDRGREAEAEPLLRRGLEIRRSRLGEDHPATLGAGKQLAVLLSRGGRHAEAETLFRQVLERERAVFGRDHYEVAEALSGLSLVLKRKGEYAEAMQVGLEDLAIRRRILGPDHADLAVALNNLATLAYAAGDLDAAERHLTEALRVWKARFGGEHEHVASALNNLGMVLRAKGEAARGEPLVREALALRRRLLGEESQGVAQSLRNLGMVLADHQAYAEAERSLAQSLAVSRRVYPARNPRLAEVLVAFGDLRLAQGRPASAEALLEEAVAIRRERLGASHLDTATAEAALGVALVQLRRWREAEALLAAALPRIAGRRTHEEDAARAARALRRARAAAR